MGKTPNFKGPVIPFVQLEWGILNSRAYRELPASAAKALPFFLGKVKKNFRDRERNHIDFEFTYKEAERLGFSKGTFAKIIKDLSAYGFINPQSLGGLRGAGLSSSVFRLSSRWKNYGTEDFEEVRLYSVI